MKINIGILCFISFNILPLILVDGSVGQLSVDVEYDFGNQHAGVEHFATVTFTELSGINDITS